MSTGFDAVSVGPVPVPAEYLLVLAPPAPVLVPSIPWASLVLLGFGCGWIGCAYVFWSSPGWVMEVGWDWDWDWTWESVGCWLMPCCDAD